MAADTGGGDGGAGQGGGRFGCFYILEGWVHSGGDCGGGIALDAGADPGERHRVGQRISTTPGAYSVGDSANHWSLMELDASGGKMIFSATGIGGSSIVLDAAGNIYLAGSSIGTTTPPRRALIRLRLCRGTIVSLLSKLAS